MISKLSSLVESFGSRRVLLVGDFILDRYVYGDAERMSPEAPVPVLRATERFERVGGSANVAACLRALNIDVCCGGIIGDDEPGVRLLALLDEIGTDHRGLIKEPGRPTTTKTRLVGLAQHRHRQQLLRLDEETTQPPGESERERLRRYVASVINEVDAVCIEDYNKGVVTAELVAAVVKEAARAAIPVLVDPARMADYARYRGASVLTPNRSELATATGCKTEALEEVSQAALDLRRRLDVDALIVTLDREGAGLARRDGSWEHLSTRVRSVYDNTGAGDAVLAMLAAAMICGAEFDDAVRLANIAGGLEVERFGCVPITKEQVLADLRIEERRHVGKLRSIDELVPELDLRRDRGEVVVFTNGCFDLLHPGHVDFLRRAAALGSCLVVGLNTDRSVRAQNKDDNRPIFNQSDRATMLAAWEWVDYVTLFDDPEPEPLIRAIRPDVLVKGTDWADKGVVGREFVESYGGRVELLPLLEGYSTTALVERIRRSNDS